jgi:MFS family permease
MIKKAMHQFLKRSHFWRDAGFDELSELYISNMLRSIALTIFLIFVPFYLYQHDYSAVAILTLFGCFFAVRAAADIGAGFFVGRFGPKHTMLLSNLMQIISSSLLLTVPQQHWNILILALPWAIANSLFFISYHVSFSKIKHTPKAGAELGHMQAFEKVGFLLGPLIGGVVGSVFGPEYIFITATALLIISLWPLFLTNEPTKVHQKIDFKTLPVHKIKKDIFAYASLGVENTLCINTWPFYVAVFLLSGAVYAQLGVLSALGVLAAVLSAKAIGHISDSALARPIMRLSVSFNILLHAVRPFVSGIAGVLAVNVANEAVTSGYRMPFIKGIYAAADDLPGYRIAYISTLESVSSIAKATAWFILAILATVLSLKAVLIVGFAMAAIASVGITKERFAIYNQK